MHVCQQHLISFPQTDIDLEKNFRNLVAAVATYRYERMIQFFVPRLNQISRPVETTDSVFSTDYRFRNVVFA